MKVKECKSACNELDIPLSGKRFKNGKPCFKGRNGKCFQNGMHGKKALRICTNKGSFIDEYIDCVLYLYNKVLLRF